MAFRYTRPPWSQHALTLGLVALALVAWSRPEVAAVWADITAHTSAPALFIGGLWALHQAVFWLVTAFFLVVDHTDRPGWVSRHRIQDGDVRRPPTRRVLRVLFINQFVLSPVMLALVYQCLVWRGWTLDARLPGPVTTLWQLAVMSALSVVFFYVSHRFLHRKWWMAKVHRVHHEFRSTTAWASEYAHPVEFVVGNFGTLAIGVVALAPSLPVIYLFTLVSMTVFLVHHAGYAIPWAPWSVHHDWHHFRYREAFGTTGLLDRWFSTDREFRTLRHGDVRR